MRAGFVAGLAAVAVAGGLALVGVGVAAHGDPPPPAVTPTAPPSAGAPSDNATTDNAPADSEAADGGAANGATTDGGGDALPARRLRSARVDPGAVPVELSIPRIGVSSSLVRLGIAGDGTLQVPTDFQRAGWLKAGPAPGERGPAVIAGHVDSKAGPAVFARLRELRPGDAVAVRRADGRTVTFTVDGSEQVAKNRFPSADVYGPVPGPVLRLITCGGSFDRATGHYRDNVVVFASIHA